MPQTGNYTVELWAEGFIPSTVTNYTMSCSSPVCDHVKLVSMSPTLAPGQTRIMMTWEKERPADVDIHVMSVRRSNNETCRTFYGYKVELQKKIRRVFTITEKAHTRAIFWLAY